MYIVLNLLYIEYAKLCTFFKKLCTLNIQSFLHSWKVWILNIQTLHSQQFVLKMFIHQKIACIEYKKLCTFFKKKLNKYFEFRELCILFENLCTYNIQNYVHFLNVNILNLKV